MLRFVFLCLTANQILVQAEGPFREKAPDCRFELKNKLVNLQTTLVFKLETDNRGSVVKVDAERDHSRIARFLDLDSVTSCLRDWTLEPDEIYVVAIGYGTTGRFARHIFLTLYREEHEPVELVMHKK